MTFADGTCTQVVEIRIADDNRTAGGLATTFFMAPAAESLTGSAGNDSYHVTAGDRVIEAANGGIDTVYSNFSRALEANVETFVLTGTASINATGNALANRLTGKCRRQRAERRHRRRHWRPAAPGNDTYIVDNARDTVVEGWNGGTDTVRSTVGWTLGANFENLILLGGSSPERHRQRAGQPPDRQMPAATFWMAAPVPTPLAAAPETIPMSSTMPATV